MRINVYSQELTSEIQCPLCGNTGPHPHSPEEIVIYRNGVKYGRSLKSASDETFEWRPIDLTRPPSGHVLIAMLDGWVTEADYAAGSWWHGGRALSGIPTHWHPMPKAPSQKAGEQS